MVASKPGEFGADPILAKIDIYFFDQDTIYIDTHT